MASASAILSHSLVPSEEEECHATSRLTFPEDQPPNCQPLVTLRPCYNMRMVHTPGIHCPRGCIREVGTLFRRARGGHCKGLRCMMLIAKNTHPIGKVSRSPK